MCWMCNRYARTAINNGLGDEISLVTVHATAPTAKFDFASFEVGGVLPPLPAPVLLITTDNVPGDTSTTVTLTVGAPSTISTIDVIADQDYYRVELEAGQSYEIGMYGYAGGPSGTPLADAYVEVRDAAGNLLVEADGGASTPANEFNSGFDVLLTFNPTTSGTYYINARAFEQTPANGEGGDFVGDYELFVREALPDAYQPYYEVDSPLYAIDWGSQVDGTARNPDGNEGIRETGNAQGTPEPGPYAIAGKNVITIYFAKEGDVFVSEDPANPGLPPAIVAVGATDFEREAVWTALHEFEKVADVIYVEVQDRAEANFFYVTYQGTPGPGISLLGSMSPPGETDEGLAQFNSGDYRWNEQDLQQGGFSFVTLIHEFGHGHGLAHPHDTGGRSGIMRGVEGTINTPAGQVPDPTGVYPNYTMGDYDLNQQIHTMMSYQDGWPASPYGNAPTNVGYGYLGSLMAFDIAAIQDKYGVNEDWATGNDTYVLKDENAPGTYYSSIWDNGGIDSIVYVGDRDANIDLRAASLEYEYGGGGWVSYAYGIYGGFTIANAVTIENAISGAGDDTLTGNAVANILNGGAGADAMAGGDDNDLYVVDNANDLVNEAVGGGNDGLFTSVNYVLVGGSEVEILSAADNAATTAINIVGNQFAQVLYGNAGVNVLAGGSGADLLIGFGGDDVYYLDDAAGSVVEQINGGYDALFSSVNYALGFGIQIELIAAVDSGATNALNFVGNELANVMYGNAGVNVLVGGGGADLLAGLAGNDVYYVDDAAIIVNENTGGGNDVVYATTNYTLTSGSDIELLSALDNSATTAINLGGNALANIIYANNGTNTLNGGAGADTLYGLGGADTFAFNSALGGGNVDALADFNVAADTIQLDDAVFTALSPGALAAGAFAAGAAAGDFNDRIVYNAATGNIFYDADGSGVGAAVLFATVQAGTALTASDFTVI